MNPNPMTTNARLQEAVEKFKSTFTKEIRSKMTDGVFEEIVADILKPYITEPLGEEEMEKASMEYYARKHDPTEPTPFHSGARYAATRNLKVALEGLTGYDRNGETSEYDVDLIFYLKSDVEKLVEP